MCIGCWPLHSGDKGCSVAKRLCVFVCVCVCLCVCEREGETEWVSEWVSERERERERERGCLYVAESQGASPHSWGWQASSYLDAPLTGNWYTDMSSTPPWASLGKPFKTHTQTHTLPVTPQQGQQTHTLTYVHILDCNTLRVYYVLTKWSCLSEVEVLLQMC